MVQLLGTIDSIAIPDPQPGVPPKPDDATVVVNVAEPYGNGTITLKIFPAATAGLVVGPARLQVDAG